MHRVWEWLRNACALARLGADRPSRRTLLLISLIAPVLERLWLPFPPVDVTIHGVSGTIRLRLRDRSDLEALLHVFVREEYALPEGLEPRVIVDLGANIGLASLYFADRHPQAEIHAFEPDPRSYARLCANVREHPRIRAYPCALSERPGPVAFTSHAAHLCSALASRRQDGRRITVPGRDLESLLALVARPVDVLKFDIEGAEVFLFRRPELLSRVGYLLGEVHPDLAGATLERLIQPLEGIFGFVAVALPRGRWLLRGRHLGADASTSGLQRAARSVSTAPQAAANA